MFYGYNYQISQETVMKSDFSIGTSTIGNIRYIRSGKLKNLDTQPFQI